MFRIIIILTLILWPTSMEASIPVKSFKRRYLAVGVYQSITKTPQGQRYR